MGRTAQAGPPKLQVQVPCGAYLWQYFSLDSYQSYVSSCPQPRGLTDLPQPCFSQQLILLA